ncbi:MULTISPECIES: hypothetical protein [unclassified Pseudomonas]|uniref:hypothetical protein n=1 Tax=unclassified Pseudomonas TaxID=196821 RepID=UPI00117B3A74|nr:MULTISPECIES: hypothetical protein [unclassified Pseudomonas]
MFRTYADAEIQIGEAFGSDCHLWRYIEHGLHQPWFYVTLAKLTKHGKYRDMLMLSDVVGLERLVSSQSELVKIEGVQLVSPGYFNKSGSWLMEPLLSISKGKFGVGGYYYVYRVSGGGCYISSGGGCISDRIEGSEVAVFEGGGND